MAMVLYFGVLGDAESPNERFTVCVSTNSLLVKIEHGSPTIEIASASHDHSALISLRH